jgi:hypothetical protein
MTWSKKDPAVDGPVEHLSQAELGLQDGDVVAVAGVLVSVGEGVREQTQPFTQQRVDLLRRQSIADGLHRDGVVTGREAVVQRREADAGLDG